MVKKYPIIKDINIEEDCMKIHIVTKKLSRRLKINKINKLFFVFWGLGLFIMSQTVLADITLTIDPKRGCFYTTGTSGDIPCSATVSTSNANGYYTGTVSYSTTGSYNSYAVVLDVKVTNETTSFWLNSDPPPGFDIQLFSSLGAPLGLMRKGVSYPLPTDPEQDEYYIIQITCPNDSYNCYSGNYTTEFQWPTAS